MQADWQWCHSRKWKALKLWVTNMNSSWPSLIIRNMQINRKMSYPITTNIQHLITRWGRGKWNTNIQRVKILIDKPPGGAIWQPLVKLKMQMKTYLKTKQSKMCPRKTDICLRRHIQASSLQPVIVKQGKCSIIPSQELQ